MGTGLNTGPQTTNSAVDTYQYEGWHVGVGSYTGIGEVGVNGLSGMSATFIPDSGAAVTVLGATPQVATGASVTQYLGLGTVTAYAASGSELTVAVPVPYAGTFQYMAMCDTTNPTNTTAVTFRDNGANVGTPGNIGFTIPSATAGCNGWDPTNTYAASAGDYVDFQLVTGAATNTTITWAAITFTATAGSPEWIWGMVTNLQSGSTTTYSEPYMTNSSATEANVEFPVSRACTAQDLRVMLATNNSGSSTITFTLRDNGASTAITGTIAPSTTAGVQAIDLFGTTGHTVALAAGDRIDLQISNNAGTTGTLGGWSLQCH